MTGSDHPGNGVPADIRTDIAHPARVYDSWLGGKDNFAADRAAAEQVMQVMPEILDTVRGNRRFLVRAVRFLRDAGIRQFIDIGSGLPSSPNVHEVTQADDTGARVVYVDNDPVVFLHAEALIGQERRDLRGAGRPARRRGGLVQGGRTARLHPAGGAAVRRVPAPHRGSRSPGRRRGRYLEALAPGSYLVISHATDDRSPEKMRANSEVAESSGAVLIPCGKDAILHMFNGRELVEPGLVLVSYWRPEGAESGAERRSGLGLRRGRRRLAPGAA